MTDKLESLKNEYAGFSMNEKAVNQMKSRIEMAKVENKIEARKRHIRGWAIAAAAALTIFILPNSNASVANAMSNVPVMGGFFSAITIRDYHSDSKNATASVEVNGLKSNDKTGKKTADEINREIKSLTNKYVADFKQTKKADGKVDLDVSTDIIAKTDNYFTLKLTAVEAQADSYQENHYYTIDLNTKKQVKLADLFKKNTDYKTAIKNDIKKQMLEHEKESEDVSYFVSDSAEDKKITGFSDDDLVSKASFYLDKNGNIVICYNQGDVAPMYMGALEFTLDKNAVADILK
ncbi:MAG: RsiV family protein [Lachnospiraceae bacterium]|nr:RsiV family protein [Lachnospiraceae bacterium]MDD7665473.1 RsiV family protein [Lachnospiraceae bacterium]MDY4164785.1 RsiV family protein [Lachnospiraceae bacterium]